MEAVERSWKSFEEYADCTVFQSFDWLFEWQKHVGIRADVTPVIVTASTDRGDPLIILPFGYIYVFFWVALAWLLGKLHVLR